VNANNNFPQIQNLRAIVNTNGFSVFLRCEEFLDHLHFSTTDYCAS